jgi:putative ABC transport system ATP-binding protein
LTFTATLDALIRAEGLVLHFDKGNTKALDGIDLGIYQGECLALVGPSGCGKSSLLNLLGTIESPTAGQIHFGSQSYATITDRSSFRRTHIGFVFQAFNLIATLSALDNVILPTVGTRGSANDHRERAKDLLAKLGLSGRIGHFPNQLSGGERQRVAIARALINDPKVILADEPTGSLDSANTREVLDLLEALTKETGLTVIIATHDGDVASRADRVVRMRDGKIDQRTENFS